MTPVLAVINELSTIDDRLTVRFVCDAAFEKQSRGLMKHARVPVQVSTISAGKLRRYHNETWVQRAVDIRTNWRNLVDLFKIAVGFFQSVWLLVTDRPDIVFAKGGYVCLPLGLAAVMLRIPLVIHDSDTRPGLTNRVLARFARAIATGSPLENYHYPATRSTYTGVPIDSAFHPLDAVQKREARTAIGMIDLAAPLVVATGGGLGAKSINDAMIAAGDELLARGVHVYHVTGRGHFDDVQGSAPDHPHYQVVPFVYKDMDRVLGAADIVVARGSATFLQELAGLAIPTIMVPAAHLGDQVKNAKVYEAADAVVVLQDGEIAESGLLAKTLLDLLNKPDRRHKLSQNLHRFAKPNAAADLAKIIVLTLQERQR